MSKQFHSPCLLQVEVLTVEIEHVDVDALETAAAQFSLDVEPTPHTLRLIQVTQMIKGIDQPSFTVPEYGKSGSSVVLRNAAG